jgi:hypothetical protein
MFFRQDDTSSMLKSEQAKNKIQSFDIIWLKIT